VTAGEALDLDAVDVAVIGGGVIGCAVAARLARPGRDLLLLESEPLLGTGVTSRNSGVIHSGLYYPPDSLKAAACVRGNPLLYEWAERHGVWYRKTGKLVVAHSLTQLAELQALFENARASGAPGISLIDGGAVAALEPSLQMAAALFCAETGIIDQHELVLSLRAAAEQAGAVVVTSAAVQHIERLPSGYLLHTRRGDLRAERVVNAAGLASTDVARLVGLDHYTIYPCRGDYFTLRSSAGYRHLIYPVKDKANPGLGIHLTIDRSGAYRLGPDAEYVDRCDDFRPAEHKLPQFLASAARLLGPLTAEQLSYEGCGIRPKLRAPHEPAEKDFVLEEHPAGFFHLIGIESPGLTASLDLADRVAALAG
jgi:L-2-hydroxyglutarate oxidase LhgO